MLATLLVGMWIGNSGRNTTAGASSNANRSFVLPPAGGPPPSSSQATPGTTTPQASVPTTTLPATTVPATGNPTVLIPPLRSKGPGSTPQFSVAGGEWKIGWAYDCQNAPGGTALFQVFVTPAGGAAPPTPAVDESGRASQGVTTQSTAGAEKLDVKTDPGCVWVVKVTGIGG
jgi:hypothetical protein